MINLNIKTSISKIKFGALILLGVISACSREDDEVSSDNSQLIFDTRLQENLKGAFLQVQGKDLSNQPDYEGCRYRMVLYTEGIDLSFNDFGKVVNTSGNGYLLDVNFYAEKEPEPESRSYYLDMSFSDIRPVGYIWFCSLYYYGEDEGKEQASLRHGQVQIRKKGSTWIIEGIDLASYNGESASFYYEGELEIYDQRANQ